MECFQIVINKDEVKLLTKNILRAVYLTHPAFSFWFIVHLRWLGNKLTNTLNLLHSTNGFQFSHQRCMGTALTSEASHNWEYWARFWMLVMDAMSKVTELRVSQLLNSFTQTHLCCQQRHQSDCCRDPPWCCGSWCCCCCQVSTRDNVTTVLIADMSLNQLIAPLILSQLSLKWIGTVLDFHDKISSAAIV